ATRACRLAHLGGTRLSGRGDPPAHRSARHGTAAHHIHGQTRRSRCRAPRRTCSAAMSALFVTGAGTEVGKTYVAVLSLRALRAQGIAARAVKPVISGFDATHASTSDSAL